MIAPVPFHLYPDQLAVERPVHCGGECAVQSELKTRDGGCIRPTTSFVYVGLTVVVGPPALQYLSPLPAVGAGDPEWVDRSSRMHRWTVQPFASDSSDAAEAPPCTVAVKYNGNEYDLDVSEILDTIGAQSVWTDQEDPMLALGLLIDKDGDYRKGEGKKATKCVRRAIKAALKLWCDLRDKLAEAAVASVTECTGSPARRSRNKVNPFVAESATVDNVKAMSPKRAADKRPAKRQADDGEAGSAADSAAFHRGQPHPAGAAAAAPTRASKRARAVHQEQPQLSLSESISAMGLLLSTRHPEFRDNAASAPTHQNFVDSFGAEIGMLDEESKAEEGASTMRMLLRAALAAVSPSVLPRAAELNIIWNTLCSPETSPNISMHMATQFIDCFRRAAYWATAGHRDLIGKSLKDWEVYQMVITCAFGSVTMLPNAALDAAPTGEFVKKYELSQCECIPGQYSSMRRSHVPLAGIRIPFCDRPALRFSGTVLRGSWPQRLEFSMNSQPTRSSCSFSVEPQVGPTMLRRL